MQTTDTELEAWLTRLQDVAPLIEKHREECERERRLVPPVYEALQERGFMRLTAPRRYGGEEAPLAATMLVIEALSHLDGAAGWNVMIACHAGFFADYLPAAAAAAIYTPESSLAANLTPAGRAQAVPGGFRLTGRWPFASGCDNARWLAATSTVFDDGQPRAGANGQPQRVIAFVPISDCRRIDTWHTTGLRGTGSHDLQVDDVFVPEDRTFSHAALASGPSMNPAPAYPQAFFQLASPTVAAVALGIAREAIEAFTELATAKTPSRGTMRLAEQHTVQQRVGKAEALLRSARAYLYATVQDLVEKTHDDWSHDEATASAILAGSHATQCAVDAVDLMFDAAGGTSIYATSRLERCFRDVHTVNHHLIVSPGNVEMAGQHFLGLGFQMRR